MTSCGSPLTSPNVLGTPDTDELVTPRSLSSPTAIIVNEAGDRAVVDEPTSEAMLEALRRYERGDYLNAALSFQEILEGRIAVGPHSTAQAEFFLAKALYHLEYTSAAWIIFDDIATSSGQPYRARALPWLSAMSRRFQDPLNLMYLLGRDHMDEIDAISNQPSETKEHLYYLLGRAIYHGISRRGMGEFIPWEEAFEPLARVPESSPWFVEAQLVKAMVFVRQRNSVRALNSYHAILRHVERENTPSTTKQRHLRDLTWMHTAQFQFAISRNYEPGLRRSLQAYNQLERDSAHFDDSRFEQAWVLFHMGQHEQSLRNLDSLPADYLLLRPEAHLLRAMIHYARCDHEATVAALETLRNTHGDERDELRELRSSLGFERAFEIAIGRADVSRWPSRSTSAFLAQAPHKPSLRRRVDSIDRIDEELDQLASSSEELHGTPLHNRILSETRLLRSIEAETLERSVSRFLQIREEEISGLIEFGLAIEVESTARLDQPNSCGR